MQEEVAKVATNTIDAMKSQPMLLLILVLNVIIFAAITWSVSQQRHDQHEVVKLLLEQNARQIEALQRLNK